MLWPLTNVTTDDRAQTWKSPWISRTTWPLWLAYVGHSRNLKVTKRWGLWYLVVNSLFFSLCQPKEFNTWNYHCWCLNICNELNRIACNRKKVQQSIIYRFVGYTWLYRIQFPWYTHSPLSRAASLHINLFLKADCHFISKLDSVQLCETQF